MRVLTLFFLGFFLLTSLWSQEQNLADEAPPENTELQESDDFFSSDSDDFFNSDTEEEDFSSEDNQTLDTLFNDTPVKQDWQGGIAAEFSVTANVHRYEGLHSADLFHARDVEENIVLSADFLFNPLTADWLRIGGIFTTESNNFLSGNINNNGQNIEASSDYALLDVGFEQLYFYLDPTSVSIIVGKYPLAVGNSPLFSPANYLRTRGSFWDSEGVWLADVGLTWSWLNINLRYFPAWKLTHTRRSNQRDHLEQLFSWLESDRAEHTFNLDLGLFLEPLNLHFLGYLSERIDPNETPYLATAFTANFGIGAYFRVYAEGLLGNGVQSIGRLNGSRQTVVNTATVQLPRPATYVWEDGPFDQLDFRGLFGVLFSPISTLDLSLEYYFNSAALNEEQARRWKKALADYGDYFKEDPRQIAFASSSLSRSFDNFNFAQHYVSTLFNWRDIELGNGYLSLQSLFSLSLAEISLFNRSTVAYEFDENFSVALSNDAYIGAAYSAFGMNASILRPKVSFYWEY